MVHVGTLDGDRHLLPRAARGGGVGLVSRPTRASGRAWRLAMLLLVATIPTGIIGLLLNPTSNRPSRTRFRGVDGDPDRGSTPLSTSAGTAARIATRCRISTPALSASCRDSRCFRGSRARPPRSRAGSSWVRGRWAADFTFLLAIPAIVGAAGLEIVSALRHQGPGFFATGLRNVTWSGPRSPGSRAIHDRLPDPAGLHPEGPLVRALLLRLRLVLILFFPKQSAGVRRSPPGRRAGRGGAEPDRAVDEDAAEEIDRSPASKP